MSHDVVLHTAAEDELGQLYDYIAGKSGSAVAWKYILGVREFVDGLADFPERGSIRESTVPGLRVIGYRRSLSIAFHVLEDRVVILGFFYNGRLATSEVLQGRL